jgi:hypothetical protein
MTHPGGRVASVAEPTRNGATAKDYVGPSGGEIGATRPETPLFFTAGIFAYPNVRKGKDPAALHAKAAAENCEIGAGYARG